MKIIIREKGHKKLILYMPLWVIINPITTAVLSKKSALSYSQAQEIMKELKKSSRLLKETPLIEITEKNGDKITLFI